MAFKSATPRLRKPVSPFFDDLLEWFFRYAASGGIPAGWYAPDYSQLPQKQISTDTISIEIVSHCWNYANILTYQLSSLVLFPPREASVCMTVYYEEGDERTKEVLSFFARQDVDNVQWNFCAIEKSYLLRRAIGRNLSAKNTKSDWVFFTDCDVLFRDQALDIMAKHLKDRSDLLVYPRYHKVTDLLPDDDSIFVDFSEAGMIRNVDTLRFSLEERTRAVGAFQITRGDAARLGGYCNAITYYHRPVKHWRKCYEDRTFRWLLGTQGTPLDVPGFYRLRHATKGRKGKTVGGG